MHYVITNGGTAPNIVPEFAESYYMVRHPDPRVVVAHQIDDLVRRRNRVARETWQ